MTKNLFILLCISVFLFSCGTKKENGKDSAQAEETAVKVTVASLNENPDKYVDKLVKISVVGEVASPIYGRGIYRISAQGDPVVLPGAGGITYNIRVGDFACGWEADHVEPGVSVENKENDSRFARGANTAFNVNFCLLSDSF